MTPEAQISNGPDENAYSEWMRQYRSQKRVVDEETGVLRAILKRAKDAGCNTKSIRHACKAATHDSDDVISDLRDTLRCMTILRIGVTPDALFAGWQVNLSDGQQQQDEVWVAEDAGFQAGRHGKPLDDTPYPPGTPLAQAYHANWDKGQASIARELGENVEQIVPRKRGRPPRQPALIADTLPAIPKRPRGRPPKNGHVGLTA
jgi:hypothetical protein